MVNSPRVCDLSPNHQVGRLSAGALQGLQGHPLLRQGMSEGRLAIPQAQLRPPQQPAPMGFPHCKRSKHWGTHGPRLPGLRSRLSLKALQTQSPTFPSLLIFHLKSTCTRRSTAFLKPTQRAQQAIIRKIYPALRFARLWTINIFSIFGAMSERNLRDSWIGVRSF